MPKKTTDRIDHAANAMTCLYEVGHLTGLEEFARADLKVKAAQVEATLALVEQQRIANLIAVAASDTMDVSRKWYPAMPLAYEHVRQEIAAALGIEVETDEL